MISFFIGRVIWINKGSTIVFLQGRPLTLYIITVCKYSYCGYR